MQLTEQWLREMVDLPISLTALAEILTRAGLEVEGISLVDEINNQTSVLALKIPPNRGDCLSVVGLSREIASFVPGARLKPAVFYPSTVALPNQQEKTIALLADSKCTHYIGCFVESIQDCPTPDWMKQRLIAAGFQSVSVVVDILNYVMLECGQPLHAFDADVLQGVLQVRFAKSEESIQLLDGRTIRLDPTVVVIADDAGVQAIAGIMGGWQARVTPETKRILIESAYFDPISIRMTSQRLNLKTDAAYRFERGVDPTLQTKALNRAVEYITQIMNAKPTATIEHSLQLQPAITEKPAIFLAHSDIQRLLGLEFEASTVQAMFEQLHFVVEPVFDGYKVCVPAYRVDIHRSIDLIEELARVHGLDQIPSQPFQGFLKTPVISDTGIQPEHLKDCLVQRGYFEVITYSFIETTWMEQFALTDSPLVLKNPIASHMAFMRPSLWPGLLKIAHYNQARQQKRLRFFEYGHCFKACSTKERLDHHLETQESARISALVAGSVAHEQWGLTDRPVDFYDLKGDLEALLESCGLQSTVVHYALKPHPLLESAQSVQISYEGCTIGYLGKIQDKLLETLALQGPFFGFEIDCAALKAMNPQFQSIAKFPMMRRDLAFFVDRAVSVETLKQCIQTAAGPYLKQVFVFDVFYPKDLSDRRKSVAFGLFFQNPLATLEDDQVKERVDALCVSLKESFGAILRDAV